MDIDAIFAEIDEAAEHVPFGNSAFQIAAFTGGLEAGTPERRHRTLLLNMAEKRKAVRETQFRRRRLDIDLLELRAKLAAATGYDRDRLALDIEEKESVLPDEDKLIRDALVELEVMFREWKALPPLLSRRQFEAAEPVYFARRLWGDAQREIAAHGAPAPGTLASLNQMGLEARRDPEGWRLSGPSNLIAALAPPEARQPMEITDGR